MDRHPGGSDAEHVIRERPVAVPATILCCPIKGKEKPVTMLCLAQYGRESVVLRWLDPESKYQMKYGMREAIADFWTGERDLIHIDHDMLFTWEHLRDLVNCHHDWCVCPYYSFELLLTAPLGFTKFSAELQSKIDLDHVFTEADNCEDTEEMEGCYGDWWGFEYHLVEYLVASGEWPCQHRQVLNDHPLTGLAAPSEKILSVDRSTEEGRAAMIEGVRNFWKTHPQVDKSAPLN